MLTGLPAPRPIAGHHPVTMAGWLLMSVPIGYVVVAAGRRTPLRLWRVELPVPSSRVAVAQIALSCLEWSLVGGVLYVLLPPSPLPFITFLACYFVAVLLGMASHVPGGIGVFEGVMVLLLKPYVSSAQLLPSLVVFRGVYYLMPLAVALTVLIVDDLRQRRQQAARAAIVVGRITEWLTPRVLAVCTFLGGVILLFSGATPASGPRLAWLGRVLPLQVIEASHFLASVAGAGLLLLSQGLARRLDGAYYPPLLHVGIDVDAQG